MIASPKLGMISNVSADMGGVKDLQNFGPVLPFFGGDVKKLIRILPRPILALRFFVYNKWLFLFNCNYFWSRFWV